MPPVLPRAGQCALTAYLLQGLLAGLIFRGHGLGLFGQFGHAALLPMAIATALFGDGSDWSDGVARGPVEHALRHVTYGPAAA